MVEMAGEVGAERGREGEGGGEEGERRPST